MRGFLVRCAAAAAAVLVLAGCTGADPKTTVDDAVQAAGAQQQATMTVRLETTPEDLQKIAGLAQTDSEDAESISQVVKLAPKLSFTLASRVHDGTLPKDVKTLDQMDFAAKIAVDDKPVELVMVKGNWYLRADVAGIGQATGLFTKTQLEMVMGEEIQAMKWLTALIDAKWTQLDPAAMTKFLAKAELGPSGRPLSVDSAKILELSTAYSTVTKTGDDTYAVTLDAKALIKGLADLDPNDDFTTEDADEAISELNDGADLNVTLTIKNGKITKAVVDLADVLRTWAKPEDGPAGDELRKLQSENFALGLAIEFSDQAEIPEPTDAAMIPARELNNLVELLQE